MAKTNLESNSRIAVLVLIVALAFALALLGGIYNVPSFGSGPSGNFTTPGIVVGTTGVFNLPISGKPPGLENAFDITCDDGGRAAGSINNGNLSTTASFNIPPSVLANGGRWKIMCNGITGFFGGGDNSPTVFQFIYQTFGQPQAGLQTGVVGHPISTGTGELYEELEPDLFLGGPLPLEFRRYYGSLTTVNGTVTRLGNNWEHNFEWVLTLSGSSATVNFFEGKAISFVLAGKNYVPASQTMYGYQLVSAGTGSYQFLDPRTNLVYTFSGSGTTLGLSQIQDRNGNTLIVAAPTSISTTGSVSDGLGRTILFNYDPSGKLVSIKDQTGRSVSFSYTGSDLTRVTDVNGKSENYTYTTAGTVPGLMLTHALPLGNTPYTQTFDKFGRVATQTDSRSDTTTITYDQPGGVTSYRDPLGAVTSDTNANYSLLTGITDADRQNLTVTYDAAGRRTSVTDRMGGKISVTYHSPSGYVGSITDALGQITTYTYTPQTQGSFIFYNLTKTQFADGTSETTSYDGSGNATAITDRAGKTTRYAYNSRGQVTSATDPAGRVITYTYNSADATLASITDPAGNVTSLSYDNAKRVSQTKFADGSTRSYTYDNRNNILRITDERSKSNAFAYTDNNRLTTLTDALGKSTATAYDTDEHVSKHTDRTGANTSYVYNQTGQTKSVTTPAGETFSFTYDAQHRLATAVDPSGNGLTFGYDKEGGLISSADALNRKTAIARDAMGRAVQITTPGGGAYKGAYDKLSNLTSRTDPTSRSVNFNYDSRSLISGIAVGDASASYARDDSGLVISATDPIGSTWSFSYDTGGRLTSRTDPLKRATSYTYDNRNRVAGVQTATGTVAFTYDPAGNRTRSQFSDGTDLAFTYDDDNRLLSAPGVTLAYDAEGRITASNNLTIGRDADGRMNSVTYGQGKTVTYTYNSNGLLATVSDWIGGSTTFTYDAAHQLTAIKRANGSGTQYTYDADGHIASITEDAGSSIAIQRDAAGRILSENRTQPTAAAPAPGLLPITYDAAHQVSGFDYDAMGRLTADRLRIYTWDSASRLTSYNGADGSMTAAYNGLGLRTSATQQGTTLNFVWNYATPLPSLTTVADPFGDRRYYVYTPDGTLLYGIDAATNARHYYHFDETGSTVLLTDDSGAVTDSYGIGAYGESVVHAGSTDNPFTWQGQLGVMQEASTSLYYMRARYYDSATARFLSPDPVISADPLRISPYEFAMADPVNNSDPTGRDGWPGMTCQANGLPPARVSTEGLDELIKRLFGPCQNGIQLTPTYTSLTTLPLTSRAITSGEALLIIDEPGTSPPTLNPPADLVDSIQKSIQISPMLPVNPITPPPPTAPFTLPRVKIDPATGQVTFDFPFSPVNPQPGPLFTQYSKPNVILPVQPPAPPPFPRFTPVLPRSYSPNGFFKTYFVEADLPIKFSRPGGAPAPSSTVFATHFGLGF